uniref:Protein phosphatase, Mg2+/Mn2+ dependent, 1H n=1 Tax=Scophthalmus maximus TaxID=52904 RepID=A0A8D3CIE0_SCOMX
MLTRVKSAVANLMGGMMAGGGGGGGANGDHPGGSDLPLRFAYGRPEFLGLSPDEVECSADHVARPILILKETRRLPWATGYAEVINAGKSTLNEDQACCEVLVVKRRPAGSCTPNRTSLTRRRSSLPNGEGLGLRENLVSPTDTETSCFHQEMFNFFHHIHELNHLVKEICILTSHKLDYFQRMCVCSVLPLKGLVCVCVCVFVQDVQIEKEKAVYNISGGCTALAVVCLLGKLYVGNAGDSRAIIIRAGEVIPMSAEFTPESERQRLQFLAYMQPHLLGNEFTHLEFPRRVQRKEVGKRMLYRDFTMSGWAYKTIEDDDLKFPLIYGEGKKARVLATIGVTRGLGDHNLKVHDSNIYIKPFLSCCPEVKVYPLAQCEHGADDVLVLGTDGLWDVLSNQEVNEAVTSFLSNCDPDDQHRYTMAAQDLIMRARGVLKDRGWRISNDRLGSGDDISVYIIPLMYGNTH